MSAMLDAEPVVLEQIDITPQCEWHSDQSGACTDDAKWGHDWSCGCTTLFCHPHDAIMVMYRNVRCGGPHGDQIAVRTAHYRLGGAS
ncbi:hypothetical protein SEA_PHINKY_5 [Microbacterium phage Phinky]|nr:hypothetical protein SEA_PHINKY_5 [Microbacterium phage Phinky]